MTNPERTVIALVPARGGSKGMPRKNLAMLAGKTLVEHTLEAALASESIHACYLSSDDAQILEIGRMRGVRTLRRPAEFATDEASALDVVRHFIDATRPDFPNGDPLIVYLQPTSPLRGARHIDEAFRVLGASGGSALVSVVELEKSPYKSFNIDDTGRLKSLFDERLSNARRQDLPPAYIPNGAIYIFSRKGFLERGGFPSNGSIPFVMSAVDSIDIDGQADFERVEKMLGVSHG